MSSDRTAIRIFRVIGLAIFILILILAACTGQPSGSSGASVPSRVEVIEKEFTVEAQASSIKAGEVTFEVKNEGALEHNFVVEGVDETIELILPQESKTLKVNLPPGTYRLVCNLPGHEEAGMFTEIAVK